MAGRYPKLKDCICGQKAEVIETGQHLNWKVLCFGRCGWSFISDTKISAINGWNSRPSEEQKIIWKTQK